MQRIALHPRVAHVSLNMKATPPEISVFFDEWWQAFHLDEGDTIEMAEAFIVGWLDGLTDETFEALRANAQKVS